MLGSFFSVQINHENDNVATCCAELAHEADVMILYDYDVSDVIVFLQTRRLAGYR